MYVYRSVTNEVEIKDGSGEVRGRFWKYVKSKVARDSKQSWSIRVVCISLSDTLTVGLARGSLLMAIWRDSERRWEWYKLMNASVQWSPLCLSYKTRPSSRSTEVARTLPWLHVYVACCSNIRVSILLTPHLSRMNRLSRDAYWSLFTLVTKGQYG